MQKCQQKPFLYWQHYERELKKKLEIENLKLSKLYVVGEEESLCIINGTVLRFLTRNSLNVMSMNLWIAVLRRDTLRSLFSNLKEIFEFC